MVSFDGYVADKYVNPREHFGESTIDVRAGDAGAKKHTGPVFQIGWYGHDDPIEKFKVGEKVRVTALLGMVYEFDPHQVFLVADDSTPALSRR